MKKILGFVLLLLIVTSCEAKKERFELNLTKGETYTQQMASNMSILQTIGGQQINTDMSSHGKMT